MPLSRLFGGREHALLSWHRKVNLRCGLCNAIILTIMDGSVIIESRHHGEKHRVIIAMDELRQIYEMYRNRKGTVNHMVNAEVVKK